MKFYLMVVPFLANSKLELYPKSLPGGSIVNMVLQIFLIIGGAWAVYKSQSLLMQILNPQAAQAEQQAASLLTGVVVGAASTGAAAGAAIVSDQDIHSSLILCRYSTGICLQTGHSRGFPCGR